MAFRIAFFFVLNNHDQEKHQIEKIRIDFAGFLRDTCGDVASIYIMSRINLGSDLGDAICETLRLIGIINKVPQKSAIHMYFPPFTSLGPSHCNVACLEIDNGTVRFLLHTVRAKVIYASR